MPSLEGLERFKKELNSLGNEAEVLARKGERLEDLQPPEGGAAQTDADLEALLATLQEGTSEGDVSTEGLFGPIPEPGSAPPEEAVSSPSTPASQAAARAAVEPAAASGRAPSAPGGAPPAPPSEGLVDIDRTRARGPGLLRRAAARTASAEAAGRAPAAPPAEEVMGEPSPEQEPASDLFLDEFLRSEDRAEESELTDLSSRAPSEPGAADLRSAGEEPLAPSEGAEPPLPEPGPLEPGSDEELFFTVPSFEELDAESPEAEGASEVPPGFGEEPPAEEPPGFSEEPAPVGEAEQSEGFAGEEPPGLGEEAIGLGEELPGLGEEAIGAEPPPSEEFAIEGLDSLVEPGYEAETPLEPPEGGPAQGSGSRGGAVEGAEAPAGAEEFASGIEEPFGGEPFEPEVQAPEAGEIDLGGMEGPASEELASLGDLEFSDDLLAGGQAEGGSPSGPAAKPPEESSGFEAEPTPEPPREPPQAAGEGDDLALGDIGQQLGFAGEPPAGEEELNPALAVGAEEGARGSEPPRPERPFQLSDRDFRRLQATLASLPRNLRLAVAELIGERGLGGEQLRQLVDLLVAGASPREIAAATGRILGRRIAVPAAYARRTGLEFEAERGTFAYRFRRNILPILQTLIFAGLAIALVVFLGYRYVYRPFHALTLYGIGYEDLKHDELTRANDYFDRATIEWRIKGWYYRYAEGFIQKKQYAFAAAKYDALLRAYPGDRKGIFDYAHMESAILGNYAKAEELLNLILKSHPFDREALLAAGDNYLAWGSEDPSKYENARRDYTLILEKYGVSNEILFRMLRFFIKTDNFPEVERLEQRFQADKSIRVDPIAYAELGGYLIDKGKLASVRDILMRALKVDHSLPEIHFNLARYFKATGDSGEEAKALANTLYFLQRSGPLTRSRLAMMIETYDFMGENLYGERRYLDAQQAYIKGINLYENALSQDQLRPEAAFGKLYSNLGDLNYYQSGNYAEALRLYRKAEANGYRTPELKYKEGYIYYRDQDWADALLSFYAAAGNFSMNPALLYATANTLYRRSAFFAAEGYYDNLLRMLEQRRDEITNFQPDEVPADRILLTNLMKVYNNLGVTLHRIAQRSADSSRYSQALVDLTKSSESFDQLTRNPATMEAAQTINLAFINTKAVLFPMPGYQLQLYNDLPRDMSTKEF